MYDQINGIPKQVLEVLTPLRKKYDFIHLEHPEALLYDLRSKGHGDVAEQLTDENGNFDRLKFENIVITIMQEMRKELID